MSRDVGRTVWWAKDSAWWRREAIVELGEEFGPAGPAVIDWLSCEAKAQNDGGCLRTGYRSLARGCFVDVEQARHVVSRSVTLGLLDDFEEAGRVFLCRISGWQADQTRIAAAARKAAQRERDRGGIDGAEPTEGAGHAVTPRDQSRPVTPSHAKSLNRTGQERRERPPQPPQAGEPPTPPVSRRKRDLDRYRADLQAWAPHPAPSDISRFLDLWEQTAEVIKGAVDESAWSMYLRSLHVHRTYEGELVLGCDPNIIGSVGSNYGVLLERAAGTTVRLVPCAEVHTAGEDQAAA